MKRRELLPLAAGVAGIAGSARRLAGGSPRRLRRPSCGASPTRARAPARPRDYFVYLPPGHAQQRDWPVMLFLHGDGERGDAHGELDYVLTHGPLFEAWCQKRDLPFVIISPQLPKFGHGRRRLHQEPDPAIRFRSRAQASNPRPDPPPCRLTSPCRARPPTTSCPTAPRASADGWSELEIELIAMVDAPWRVSGRRAARIPHRPQFRAVSAPGTWPRGIRKNSPRWRRCPATAIRSRRAARAAKLPLWAFAGGRDPVVPLRFFYPVLNRLEALGHPGCASPTTKTWDTSPGCASTKARTCIPGCWRSRADPKRGRHARTCRPSSFFRSFRAGRESRCGPRCTG